MEISKENAIVGYKMFDCDWKCKGFQYEVGKSYHHDGEVEACSSGFHFCEKLEDCFSYYPSVTWNHIAKVKGWGNVSKHSDDSKIAVSDIEILEEIPFDKIGEFCKKDGVSYSDGVYNCLGVSGIKGVANEIFPKAKKEVFRIFGKVVTIDRFTEVMENIKRLCGSWHPRVNNAFKLYAQYGKEWSKVPADRITGNATLDWSEMPKEAIEYIKSLPEFNAKEFKRITAIK